MYGVPNTHCKVTSAVCVKTSLNEYGGSFTWHNTGREKSGQGQGQEKERKKERSDAINNISQLFV